MSFDLEKILMGKRDLHRELAARPVAEKLRMLDALRERALTLRAASAPGMVDTDALREQPAPTASSRMSQTVLRPLRTKPTCMVQPGTVSLAPRPLSSPILFH